MAQQGGIAAGSWLEHSRNPFLVREWRRTARSKVHPLVVGWVLIGLSMVGLAAVIAICLAFIWLQRSIGENIGLGPSSVGNAARFAAVWVIGAAAWTVIGLGYWLAVGQTWIEEQQVNLDLLLVTPLSRAGIVRSLMAWPLAGTALCLLPLVPLLVLLMPFLGLSFGGAARVAVAILLVAMLPMVRGPSAAGMRAERRTQRSLLALVLYGLLALIAVPILSQICVRQLGLAGFSLLRWPLALGEALVARPAFWNGDTWLGGWVVAVLATALLARGLAAWQRLGEGGETRAAQPVAVAPLLWALSAWVIGGLWVGRHALVATPDRLWYGFHLSMGLAFITTAGARQRWLLWWLPERWTGRWAVVWAELDAALVACLPALLWMLSQRVMGAPSSWPAGAATLELAALQAMLAGWFATAAAGGSRRAERTGLLLRFGVPTLWFGWAVSELAPSSHGWAGRCFGWTPLIQLGVGLLAVVPLLSSLALRTGDGGRQGARRTGEQSLVWRLLPDAWRANPLVIKGLRTASRRGAVRASAWSLIAVAVVGLTIGLLSERLAMRGSASTTSDLAALLGVHLLAGLGQTYAQHWFGAGVGFGAATFLGLGGLLTAGMAFVLPVLSAALCGKVVTAERLHGSLGFVLLTDLTDHEVADGYLVGQLYPVLELLVYFAITVMVWALATLHWQIVVLAAVAVVAMAGLVAAVAAAALLGTARYASRADGTVDSLVGVALFHVAGWSTVLIASKVGASATAGWPQWPLALVWSGVTLMVGWLTWRATPAAFRRLRRSRRLWQAFDPAARDDRQDGGL